MRSCIRLNHNILCLLPRLVSSHYIAPLAPTTRRPFLTVPRLSVVDSTISNNKRITKSICARWSQRALQTCFRVFLVMWTTFSPKFWCFWFLLSYDDPFSGKYCANRRCECICHSALSFSRWLRYLFTRLFGFCVTCFLLLPYYLEQNC